MAITNAQRDKAWIDMINGKRKTAGGKIIRTKADLLEVKQYLPMVSQAVKDAYNKRMASFRDSADSVETIAAKYGHEMQNKMKYIGDAAGSAIENLKALVSKAKKAVKAKSGDRNAMTRLMNELVMARIASRSEYDALAKEAYNLSGELDSLVSNFKKGK